MNTEESRKQFEEYIANKKTLIEWNFHIDSDGEYTSSRCRLMWEIWQAARANTVKLPKEAEYDLWGDEVTDTRQNAMADGYNEALKDAETAILAAGFEVE